MSPTSNGDKKNRDWGGGGGCAKNILNDVTLIYWLVIMVEIKLLKDIDTEMLKIYKEDEDICTPTCFRMNEIIVMWADPRKNKNNGKTLRFLTEILENLKLSQFCYNLIHFHFHFYTYFYI